MPPSEEYGVGDATAQAVGSDTERALREIWQRHLGRKGAGTGGHILHMTVGARRLLKFREDLHQTFGINVGFSTLMKLGSFEALLSAIKQDVWPTPGPLVLLRDGDPEKTLYIVSAGGGVVLELCDLAMLIDFPGQIWALQLPGIDGEAEPMTRIDAMAQYFVTSVLAHGSKPPYSFLAYSFGGLVAVEMARILEEQGHQLGLVALMDTITFEKYWPRSAWLLATFKRLRYSLGQIAKKPPAQAAKYFVERLAAFIRQIRRRALTPTGTQTTAKSAYYIGGLQPDFQRVRDASIIAFETHDPAPVDFKVVLFKSTHGDPHACDPVGVWKALARNLEIITVPGTHLTMIRKSVAGTLAAEISRRLS